MKRAARLVAVLWLMLLSQSCSLYVNHLARHDFENPATALEKAKVHSAVIERAFSLPNDFDSMKWDREARQEMGARIDRLFGEGDFNGAELRFWEYSSGNSDPCDDGWVMHSRVVVDPRRKTKRGWFRLPYGQYRITRADGTALQSSRSLATIDGERRYEYCYDVQGTDANTWMRYYFAGESVER